MTTYKIMGAPIPWKRARRFHNKYFDSQALNKRKIRNYLVIQGMINGVPVDNPLTKPFVLTCRFVMPIPNSWSLKKKTKAVGEAHSTTPDLDNLVKFIQDAFNGFLWEDDKLISEIQASKVYGSEPSTEVTVHSYS